MLWCAGFASVACNLIVIIAKWTDGHSFNGNNSLYKILLLKCYGEKKVVQFLTWQHFC